MSIPFEERIVLHGVEVDVNGTYWPTPGHVDIHWIRMPWDETRTDITKILSEQVIQAILRECIKRVE